MYTAESVREELPEVPILFDGNRVLARTYGRCLEFAQVVYQGFTWEVAWGTIANVLNNQRAVIV